MTDPRLAFLRELERADESLAAQLAEVDELYRATEEVRERAVALEDFMRRLPTEREARERAVEEAERAAVEAREAALQAEAALAAAEAEGKHERIAAARRFELRARDARSSAERRAREAHERLRELEAEAEAAEQEAPRVEAQARELAGALSARPLLPAEAVADPGTGLAGVAEWGTRARAALLVARSQLATESEAVIRQANELGSTVLGEPLAAAGTAAVARRVERLLGS